MKPLTRLVGISNCKTTHTATGKNFTSYRYMTGFFVSDCVTYQVVNLFKKSKEKRKKKKRTQISSKPLIVLKPQMKKKSNDLSVCGDFAPMLPYTSARDYLPVKRDVTMIGKLITNQIIHL